MIISFVKFYYIIIIIIIIIILIEQVKRFNSKLSKTCISIIRKKKISNKNLLKQIHCMILHEIEKIGIELLKKTLVKSNLDRNQVK